MPTMPTIGEPSAIGVLFVCHANICRSPLAEAIFRNLVIERGLQARFVIDSAGTWAPDGALPHEHSLAVAEQHGISADWFTAGSRAVRPEDMERYDHVLVMDRRNLADLERLRRLSAFGDVEGRWPRVRLMRNVVDPHATGDAADVPDPVRGGREDFEATFELLHAACRSLLDELASASRG